MYFVSSFRVFVEQLSFVMTTPTFDSFVQVLTGWVFAQRRTVTAMIQAADAVGTKHHSAFHRVFSAAHWSLDDLGLAVFELIQRWLTDQTIFLAVDDTLAHKHGPKVFGAGMHHDPLISSRKRSMVNWGHNWVILSVVLSFPFIKDKYFSLPILFRLYIRKQTAARQRGRYRPRPALAVEMLETLCNRYWRRQFHALADSTYGGQSVLKFLPPNCDLTSRLKMDAWLYDAPPARKPGTRGRRRVKGKRMPSPKQMLEQRARRHTLDIYGRHDRARVIDCVARVRHVPHRELRIVAVEPLKGGRKKQAFYSTKHTATAEQVLTSYARRWSLEETIHNAKTHLGFEQPQGWTRPAVERTAPIAMLLYSLIVLWFAAKGHRDYQAPKRPWYITKRNPSFADMLMTLKRLSVQEQLFELGLSGPGSQKVRKLLINTTLRAA